MEDEKLGCLSWDRNNWYDFLGISVHQHHIFPFLNISHDIIILYLVEKITPICPTNWSLTMEFSTNYFLFYMLLDNGRINIILSIFMWYFRKRKLLGTTNNTLPRYLHLLNVKWKHYCICIMSCFLV